MLSNSCLVFPAVVKQQQEEISRNDIPSLFAVSVHFSHLLYVHPVLMDGVQVKREGVLSEPVQHGLHGLARPRAVSARMSAMTFWAKCIRISNWRLRGGCEVQMTFNLAENCKFVVSNNHLSVSSSQSI